VFHGIKFDVRGIVQLAGRQMVDKGYPTKVTGIHIRQKCAHVHFLHATGWPDRVGRQVGNYVIRFANGQTRYVPIIYGQDVYDWYGRDTGQLDRSGAMLAWTEPWPSRGVTHNARRLFLSTWINPLPDIEIQTMDYESTMGDAAPFLIGITLEL
jgi:hypothetical protein